MGGARRHGGTAARRRRWGTAARRDHGDSEEQIHSAGVRQEPNHVPPPVCSRDVQRRRAPLSPPPRPPPAVGPPGAPGVSMLRAAAAAGRPVVAGAREQCLAPTLPLVHVRNRVLQAGQAVRGGRGGRNANLSIYCASDPPLGGTLQILCSLIKEHISSNRLGTHASEGFSL